MKEIFQNAVSSSTRSLGDQCGSPSAAGIVNGGGDQAISWEQFKGQLNSPYLVELLNIFDIERSQAKALFMLLDRDGTKTLTVEEFVRGALRLRAPARAFDVAALQREERANARKLSTRVDFEPCKWPRSLSALGPNGYACDTYCSSGDQDRPGSGVVSFFAWASLHGASRGRRRGADEALGGRCG
ncbi:unnamed protein product [Prorocentrum cordatum]|uniref:EF-hand domain-containing protein n=1 Tax=Prorocentrum cordatum TaxID=2364126 RepID=A0ABN9YE24_9DINO|nr:unnamed protein product [Polarella glacialis]